MIRNNVSNYKLATDAPLRVGLGSVWFREAVLVFHFNQYTVLIDGSTCLTKRYRSILRK